MKKDSAFADRHLAERYAMANLNENPDYYLPKTKRPVMELEYFRARILP